MARNPGTEAESANATLHTGSGVTPSPALSPASGAPPVITTSVTQSSSTDSLLPAVTAGKTGKTGKTEMTNPSSATPTSGPPPAVRTGVTKNTSGIPISPPPPVVKTGLSRSPSATPTSTPPPVVRSGVTKNTSGIPISPPPPVVKTGLTNSEADVNHTPPMGREPDVNRTPAPPMGRGLHAPATTPGPVVQQFVTLGRYQLLSRLAVGGMAEVYLARQGELSGFKTLVVVKKVLPHLAVKPDFIAMFLDEARIASMLDHPNVVRITEVGRTDNEYFLAMELVQGKPLAAILQQSEKAKTPIPHNLSALIVANAAAGLHHAHQLTDASGNPLGLVHRDVSPQNIMVSFEGSVEVIDFGIARALGRLGDTNSGSLKGKLGYMAPEQARGESVDARADIFSLGVVLWECVAGRRLFLRENELATLRAVVYEPIPSVSKFVEVDTALDAIIRRSVARSVDERFQTAEEMRIALDRWVFSSGGASTHDLSALMKSWFPSDHLQWQRAARLALDMQESDPPIDVAFPNLAANRTGHSKTGASRPESSGSGNKLRAESSNRSSGPQAGQTPVLEVPDLRPKFWRRFAVPVAIVLSLAAGGAAIFYWMGRKAPEVPPLEAQSITPVRPMVETLPGVEGTNHAVGNATPPHVGEAPRPQDKDREKDRDVGSATEETTPGKKRIRGTSSEKRAILHQENGTEGGSGKRPNPFDDRSNLKKNKDPRPNPF